MRKPLLAARFDPDNPKELAIVKSHLPLLASFKLDGVRALVQGGVVLSRSLKPVPNDYVQHLFSRFAGLDGELIVGDPASKTAYRDTVSGVMRKDGEPKVRYYVFDSLTNSVPFSKRLAFLQDISLPAIVRIGQRLCKTWEDVLAYETEALTKGFEGLVLRSPDGDYKEGRSTLKECFAAKLKRFRDSEAVVLGMTELLHNNNEPTMNETGHMARSSHKAGKESGGVMGSLQVRDIETGVEFDIGTGATNEDRIWWWSLGSKAKGLVVKYRCFPVGGYDKPRFPTLLGLRDRKDMS